MHCELLLVDNLFDSTYKTLILTVLELTFEVHVPIIAREVILVQVRTLPTLLIDYLLLLVVDVIDRSAQDLPIFVSVCTEHAEASDIMLID